MDMLCGRLRQTRVQRLELGRYAVDGGERVVYALSANGVLDLIDLPAGGRGRRYLIERGLDLRSRGTLSALVDDYLAQAAMLRAVPMAGSALRHVEELEAAR